MIDETTPEEHEIEEDGNAAEVTYIGIDPGINGAIAVLRGEHLAVYDVPTDELPKGKKTERWISPTGLVEIFDEILNEAPGLMIVLIERVRSQPRDGVASAFKFGHGYGMLTAIAAAYCHQLVEVTPAKWKKDLGLSNDKDHSLGMAEMNWPHHAELFRRKKDADRAEASLLAMYCRDFLVERDTFDG